MRDQQLLYRSTSPSSTFLAFRRLDKTRPVSIYQIRKFVACFILPIQRNKAHFLIAEFTHYKSEKICWLYNESLYYGFILPIGIMFLFNMIVFIMVFREIVGQSKVRVDFVFRNGCVLRTLPSFSWV